MILDVQGLVKKYKNFTAVNSIDLQIKEGEIFGLLGPNGAGKSTFINTLLGLTKISEGKVTIMGQDIKKNGQSIKQYIGYVPQDIALFDELSAYENVAYFAKIYGIKGKEIEKRVNQALEFTGLLDRKNERPGKYSGGMQRRLNIACAIVHNPKVLFMDEPTVGVDPQSRNNILTSIKKLNEMGTTIIYTSHYMEEVEAICNRIAIMDTGKIIAQGTIDELKQNLIREEKVLFEIEDNRNEAMKIIKDVNGISTCECINSELVVEYAKASSALSQVIERLLKANIKIKSVHVEKVNLEHVFLSLTGKTLRD